MSKVVITKEFVLRELEQTVKKYDISRYIM